MSDSFVDTNILIYAVDASETTKQPKAQRLLEELWTSRTGRLSTQVLNEFYVTTTRKLKPGLVPEMAREIVRSYEAWSPVPLTFSIIREAWALQDRYSLSYWDALIVAAAKLSGCSRLYSEDLQDGLQIDDLRVINPFIGDPDSAHT
jgi:predicted nucleic acid-binding protein